MTGDATAGVGASTGTLVEVCACGCNISAADARRAIRLNPGWLNEDQALAQFETKMIPESEVRR